MVRPIEAVIGRTPQSGVWLATAFRIVFCTVIALFLATPWIRSQLVWRGWIGVAALLYLAASRSNSSRYAWIGYTVSLAISLAFYWAPAALANQMHRGYAVGLLVFIPLLALDAIRAALPFWFAVRLTNRPAAAWLPAGLCAVVSEALVPSVFPWRFGYMQLAWPWTIQTADIFGSGWTSLMTFAHAGLLLFVWELIERHFFQNQASPRQPLPVLGWIALGLCLANALYGMIAISHWKEVAESSPSMRVALVQVEPGYVRTVPTLRRFSEQVDDEVDLVCWPESSAGCYATDLRTLADRSQVFMQSREPDRGLQPWPQPHCPLLVGASLYQGDQETPQFHFQAALLIDNQEQIVGQYRKRYLMPFGEFMPLEDWLPALQNLFPRDEVISRGTEANVLPLGEQTKLGVMLCYEDMMPQAARSLCQNSANLLVSLINASDFEVPLARAQHRLLAQMRAVECRRYLARCAATGETCVVTPWGEIEQRLPLEGEGTLVAKVRLLEQPTVYSQYGEIVPWLCALGLAACWLCHWRLRVTNATR